MKTAVPKADFFLIKDPSSSFLSGLNAAMAATLVNEFWSETPPWGIIASALRTGALALGLQTSKHSPGHAGILAGLDLQAINVQLLEQILAQS